MKEIEERERGGEREGEGLTAHPCPLRPKTSLDMFHGYNERLSSDNMVKLAQFYEAVIKETEDWED